MQPPRVGRSGWVGDAPPRVSKISVAELNGKTTDCSRLVLSQVVVSFSILVNIPPVMWDGQNFEKSAIFLTLQAHTSKLSI